MQISKKIKIEIEDNDGEKYNISVQGRFSKDKIAKILQVIDSIEDSTPQSLHETNQQHNHISHSVGLGDALWNIITDNLADKKFSSSDVSCMYRKIYNQDIYLSIVSTYLARFFTRGKLSRIKHRKEWIYSLIRPEYTANLVTNYRSITIPHVISPLSHNSHTIPTVYDLHQ